MNVPETAKLANSYLEFLLTKLVNHAINDDIAKERITELINSLRQLKLPPSLTLSDSTELAKFCSSSEVSGSNEKNKELANKMKKYTRLSNLQ